MIEEERLSGAKLLLEHLESLERTLEHMTRYVKDTKNNLAFSLSEAKKEDEEDL